MNGWLALIIVAGAAIGMKALRQKGILPEQEQIQVTPATPKPKVYKLRLVNDVIKGISFSEFSKELCRKHPENSPYSRVTTEETLSAPEGFFMQTEDEEKAKAIAEDMRKGGREVEIIVE